MTARALAVVVLVALAWTPAARADVGKAQEHYKKGMAAYVLEHWDEAIRNFEAGYSEETKPAFLYNLGQAYEKSHRYKEAASFFRKFIQYGHPEDTDRGEIEARIADDEKLAASEPPPPPVAPWPTPEPVAPVAPVEAPAPAPPPAPVVVAPPPIVIAPLPVVEPPRHHYGAWIAVAIGIVLAGAAVTAAIVFTRPSEPTLPAESFR